jgi:membrane protein implicated in regulation of membrane protease activity
VSTWEIIVIAVVAVLVLLTVGGVVARRRQLEATQGRFDANLEQVNRDLAAAHAEDRGWERVALEDAARRAYAGERDGADCGEIVLTQVVDRPGTDDDKAVFRVGSGERLTLGRRDGEWVLEALD